MSWRKSQYYAHGTDCSHWYRWGKNKLTENVRSPLSAPHWWLIHGVNIHSSMYCAGAGEIPGLAIWWNITYHGRANRPGFHLWPWPLILDLSAHKCHFLPMRTTTTGDQNSNIFTCLLHKLFAEHWAVIQNNTDMTEAYWGKLLCQWYQPVDVVRLSVSQLREYMM